MNNQGQVINSKTFVYIFGGAILGYLFFKNLEAIIIGGILGFVLSQVS